MQNSISCKVSDCAHNCVSTHTCEAKNVSIACCGCDCSKTSSETMCNTFKPKK